MFDAVEAALLNSECDPGDALDQATRALVRFAVAECDATKESLATSMLYALADRDLFPDQLIEDER